MTSLFLFLFVTTGALLSLKLVASQGDEEESCAGDCWCVPKANRRCPREGARFFLDDQQEVGELIGYYTSLREPENPIELLPEGCSTPFANVAAAINGDLSSICTGVTDTTADDEMQCLKKRGQRMNRDPLGRGGGAKWGWNRRKGLTEVCAFQYSEDCSSYGLVTYSCRREAEACGALVTHEGPCGVCSSAQDLGVNLNPGVDVAAFLCGTVPLGILQTQGLDPTNQAYFTTYLALATTCFKGELDLSTVPNAVTVSFTEECAKVWAGNTVSTFLACTAPLPPGNAENVCSPVSPPIPPQLPDCSLDACIECDETISGPTFQEFSGRTRRRSGIVPRDLSPAALKRQCNTVANLGPQNTICSID